MVVDNRSAVIDNDFLSKVIAIQRPPAEVALILKKALEELNVNAVMHPLVFDKEVLPSHKTSNLFVEGVICVASFEGIFQGDANKETYYRVIVPELYKKLTGREINTGGADLLVFWKRCMSLGEVHSMSMCLTCGCGIFLSDDGDAKRLKRIIEQEYGEVIAVYSREELMESLPKGVIKRSDARAFGHKR